MLETILSLNFINQPALWLASLIFLTSTFCLGYFLQGRSIRGKWLIEQTKLKTEQIAKLEEVNKRLAEKNRELYAKELQLTINNKHLQELESAKSKFIAVTTHQLRTPLSAVKWTLDLAAKGQLGLIDEEQKNFLSKGLASVNRVISIVNDLLQSDSLEADKLVYDFQPTDFSKLFDEVFFEFGTQARSKNIDLSFKRPKNKLPLIDLDEKKIKMVLENLLDNAIKYTPPHGQVVVIISDKQINYAEGAIEVSVGDSGIGISESEKDKIFQRFFRAGNAIKNEPDGSGLGLFIAREIIQKHGGALWFNSREGGGTTFAFTLPLHHKTI